MIYCDLGRGQGHQTHFYENLTWVCSAQGQSHNFNDLIHLTT